MQQEKQKTTTVVEIQVIVTDYENTKPSLDAMIQVSETTKQAVSTPIESKDLLKTLREIDPVVEQLDQSVQINFDVDDEKSDQILDKVLIDHVEKNKTRIRAPFVKEPLTPISPKSKTSVESESGSGLENIFEEKEPTSHSSYCHCFFRLFGRNSQSPKTPKRFFITRMLPNSTLSSKVQWSPSP